MGEKSNPTAGFPSKPAKMHGASPPLRWSQPAGRSFRQAGVYLLALGFILLAQWLATLPASAAESQPPDAACKGCHVGNPNEVALPSGDVLGVGVDLELLAQSVHGDHAAGSVFCTDCHAGPQRYRYPHEPNPAQTRQEFLDDVSQNCVRCHTPPERHNPGHLLASDTADVPACADCHGGHDAIPSRVLAADPVGTCQGCHQTYADPAITAVHQEVVANLGVDQTCQTCHTDQPIYPPDEQCQSCHSLLDSELGLPSGETIPLNVEPELILDSVHGQYLQDTYQYQPLLCTECHIGQEYAEYPHPAVAAQGMREYTLAKNQICEACHEGIAQLQEDSIHAVALAAGMLEAATCVDCHGSHHVQVPDVPRERISNTCGQCHAAINAEYATSVHGAALLGESNPDVPVCIDCHGVHNIADPTTAYFRVRSPEICADCHADEELMAKYGISTDVFETYVADFHGTTVTLFEKTSPFQETNKAVCYDCHGVHNILPATDENSQIIKANLLATCRQCHPDATENFPDSWTSHFKPSLEHNQLIYFVDLFYAILIPTVVGGFVLFILTDIYRRLVDRWRAGKEASS